jgi:hypothetical protein
MGFPWSQKPVARRSRRMTLTIRSHASAQSCGVQSAHAMTCARPAKTARRISHLAIIRLYDNKRHRMRLLSPCTAGALELQGAVLSIKIC